MYLMPVLQGFIQGGSGCRGKHSPSAGLCSIWEIFPCIFKLVKMKSSSISSDLKTNLNFDLRNKLKFLKEFET